MMGIYYQYKLYFKKKKRKEKNQIINSMPDEQHETSDVTKNGKEVSVPFSAEPIGV